MSKMRRSATLSPCRTWRYVLQRFWADDPHVLFILLNPSTADETRDDQTLRRGIGFAKQWGYGGVVYCNLFAYRTTHPGEMKQANDPIGPENDRHLIDECKKATRIVVAWGTHGSFRGRDTEVKNLLKEFELWCLGKTKEGHPKHPVRLSNDTVLERWP